MLPGLRTFSHFVAYTAPHDDPLAHVSHMRFTRRAGGCARAGTAPFHPIGCEAQIGHGAVSKSERYSASPLSVVT